MVDFAEKVKELLNPILEDEGMELVELFVKKQKNGHLLRIFIDKENGIGINDCENVSEQLGRLLDVEDIFHGRYIIEVSSPGLNRPLKSEKDFKRCIGKYVNVSIYDAGKIVKINGRVISVTDCAVTVETEKKKENIEIPFQKISSASLEIRF